MHFVHGPTNSEKLTEQVSEHIPINTWVGYYVNHCLLRLHVLKLGAKVSPMVRLIMCRTYDLNPSDLIISIICFTQNKYDYEFNFNWSEIWLSTNKWANSYYEQV